MEYWRDNKTNDIYDYDTGTLIGLYIESADIIDLYEPAEC